MRSAFWLYFLFVFLILQGFSESLASFKNDTKITQNKKDSKVVSQKSVNTLNLQNEINPVGGAEGYDTEIYVKTPEPEKMKVSEVTNLKIKTDGLTEKSILDFLKYPQDEKNKTLGETIPIPLSKKLYQSDAINGYYPVKQNCVRVKKLSEEIGSFSEKVFMISINMGPECLEIRQEETWKNALIVKELRVADPKNPKKHFTYPAEREITNLQEMMIGHEKKTTNLGQGLTHLTRNFPIFSYPEAFFSFKIENTRIEKQINFMSISNNLKRNNTEIDVRNDDKLSNTQKKRKIDKTAPLSKDENLFSDSYQASHERNHNSLDKQKASTSSYYDDSVEDNNMDKNILKKDDNKQENESTKHHFIIMHAAQGNGLSNYTRETAKEIESSFNNYPNNEKSQDLDAIYREFGKVLANFHRRFMDLKTIPMANTNIKDFTTELVNDDDSFDNYFHTIDSVTFFL